MSGKAEKDERFDRLASMFVQLEQRWAQAYTVEAQVQCGAGVLSFERRSAGVGLYFRRDTDGDGVITRLAHCKIDDRLDAIGVLRLLKARLDEQQKRQHERLDGALRLLGELLESPWDDHPLQPGVRRRRKGNHDT